MYFMSVSLGWLPPQGYGGGALKNMIMPAFTLGVAYMALLARTTRAAVVEILNQDYVRTARAKGLPALLVHRRHVMRNALILVLTTAGLQFGALMAQTVIVEKLFSWPRTIPFTMPTSWFPKNRPVLDSGLGPTFRGATSCLASSTGRESPSPSG